MTRTLTLAQLTDAGACREQVDLFRARFGDSVVVTRALAISVAPAFDFDWAADHLLTSAARAGYERVIAPARAEYERAIAPAWADFERARARALALAGYERAIDPAWADYVRATAPAWAEYDRAIAGAWADAYNRSE